MVNAGVRAGAEPAVLVPPLTVSFPPTVNGPVTLLNPATQAAFPTASLVRTSPAAAPTGMVIGGDPFRTMVVALVPLNPFATTRPP